MPIELRAPDGRPYVVGHRGAMGHAPENTFASFRRGVELGCPMLELDVHLSVDRQVMVIHEENGWIKVVDALIGEIPVLGIFTGYFFNPSYVVARMNEAPIARLVKQPAFLEGKFQMTKLAELTSEEENRVLLGLLAMTLLERTRG